MVKIRLRRLGNKGRPFYRVVVAKSTAGRNGAFVEIIGTYSAIEQPKRLEIDADRALYWLRQGAEPTETAAYLLNKVGVLGTYLEERPSQRQKYKFLDKRTKASQTTTTGASEPTATEDTVSEATPALEENAESATTETATEGAVV